MDTKTLMIPYEDISNVDRIKAVVTAIEILEKGWSRRNYPLICLGDPIPWALRNQQERSWNFYIHCWDMLDSLLKAYSETQEKKFICPAIRIAEEWSNMHGDLSQQDMSPLAWYDMAVGLRAYRLAYIIDAGVDSGLLDESSYKKLWASLEQHRAYLADETNIKFQNNHGYYQVVGQLAMGRRFAGESSLMAEALEQGKERLRIMLAQQFGKDGIHREHSPDYHRMVYDTLKSMIDSGLVDDPDTIKLADQIERALSWFVLPNQHIVNFGDSDYRLMRVTPIEASRKWRTEEMRFVVTGGQVGRPPAEAVALFLEGGYVAVRRPAKDSPQDFSKSSYLVQMAGFHSRSHKQADDLSFIWSDRGTDILVDAGRYGYLGKTEEGSELWRDGHWYSDPNRVYCESTRAHNTLEFDGKNYPRKGVKPYGSALRRLTRHSSGIVAVETECRHFRSSRRARILVFMPGSWLLVLDWFHDNEHRPHNVKQWFHLAPHLELARQAGSYFVFVPDSPQPLRIASLLEGIAGSPPYIGEQEPFMQGWWSEKERTIVPNYAFCYELSGVSNGTFATFFNFSEDFSTDTAWNKGNVSGRKARFRWKDDAGTHELRLERPESGEMSIGYSLG